MNTVQIERLLGINVAAPLFWKGNLVGRVDWDSLTIGGQVKLRLENSKRKIIVNVNELKNQE